MNNLFYMVNYHNGTRKAFDNAMIITVESGKKLSEYTDGLKLTHHYYVITTNMERRYFDTQEWFISFRH